MLPTDTRCGGHAPHASGLCPKKNECARYTTPAGVRVPFVLSFCESGFVHAETVAADESWGNPLDESRAGVLDANPLSALKGAV